MKQLPFPLTLEDLMARPTVGPRPALLAHLCDLREQHRDGLNPLGTYLLFRVTRHVELEVGVASNDTPRGPVRDTPSP